MEVNYVEAELICHLVEDEINKQVPNGMDIHWICEMTRLYEKAEKEMYAKQATAAKNGLEIENSYVTEKKKCTTAIARGNTVNMQECMDCADYKNGCEGFTKEICKYNEDLAIK